MASTSDGCVVLKYVVCRTTNGGRQTGHRQSDGRIVPLKAGNAAGGKPREDCTSQSCHAKMDGNKAAGIDGVTKEEYGKNLEENLDNLAGKLRKKSYRPKPARRVEIPKDNGKTRPLSIYC